MISYFGTLCSFLALASCAAIDWLVDGVDTPVTLTTNADQSITLSNGLAARTFSVTSGFGTIDYARLDSDGGASSSCLRAVGPEGYITLDNITYSLGTISNTAPFAGYFNRSAPGAIMYNSSGWGLKALSTGSPSTGGIPWQAGTRGSPAGAAWPPLGFTLMFELAAPASAPPRHQAVSVTLVYEMYVGAPLLSKWVVVNSSSAAAAGVTVSGVTVETLRLAPPCALGSMPLLWTAPDVIYGTDVIVATDASAAADLGAIEPTVSLTYTSGPGVVLTGGLGSPNLYPTRIGATAAEFVSFRALELLQDSDEVERYSLGVRRIPRLLAPWILENPIFFHTTEPIIGWEEQIDKLANASFEMIIFSFGSGFDLETADAAYIAIVKDQVDYARSKGIEVGGYDCGSMSMS